MAQPAHLLFKGKRRSSREEIQIFMLREIALLRRMLAPHRHRLKFAIGRGWWTA